MGLKKEEKFCMVKDFCRKKKTQHYGYIQKEIQKFDRGKNSGEYGGINEESS